MYQYQASKFSTEVTKLASIQTKTSEWLPFLETKGAIVGIPLDVTDDELLSELKTQGVGFRLSQGLQGTNIIK